MRSQKDKTYMVNICKDLAKQLDLKKGEYGLRFNPGGPAVSGEATLHAERFYVMVGLDLPHGVLYRTCNGRHDYSGSCNNWLAWDIMRQEGAVKKLADNIRIMLTVKESTDIKSNRVKVIEDVIESSDHN